MIINSERNPNLSLYYLGSLVLDILLKNGNIELEELFNRTQKTLSKELHIDFFYYTLDWLYLLSAIRLDGERVFYAYK